MYKTLIYSLLILTALGSCSKESECVCAYYEYNIRKNQSNPSFNNNSASDMNFSTDEGFNTQECQAREDYLTTVFYASTTDSTGRIGECNLK